MKPAMGATTLAAHLLLASAHAAVLGRRAELVARDESLEALEDRVARSTAWLSSVGPNLSKDQCIAALVWGLIVGCCGTSWLLSWLQRRGRSELLVGPNTHRTEATITKKEHHTTGENNEIHHYLASYTFEAVRPDGMRCLITVEPRWQLDYIGTREQQYMAWSNMSVGSKVQVIYLKSDPRVCRLDKANEHDYSKTHDAGWVGCTACATFMLVAFMILSEIAIWNCFLRKSENGHLIASLIMGASIALFIAVCTPSIIPGLSPLDVTEKELGYQKKAESLGDISGTWIFQSTLGTFEYEFVMATETTVTTRGRPQGSGEWDASCEGHFVGEEGTELIWDDDQGSHVRVKFDDHGGLSGSIHTDGGEQVDFTGARPAAA